MILPDYPIENSDEDKLRRTPLARKVAELIKNFEGKESFVIGIEGVWGSGKTSFINLTLKELHEDENIIVVHFNPWNFTGQNELITDFFATLNRATNDEDGIKDLANTLHSYSSKLQFSLSPSISILGFGIGLGNIRKKGGTTLQEEREQIDIQLRAITKKIVIIIDDIDRLDNEETRLIMKLVKMTANFPNTIFLLAYDRKQVADKLGKEGIGEEYLKKIMQVSFTLPQPDKLGLRKILFDDLDDTIEGVYGETKLEGKDEQRWGSIVSAGFPDLFKTIRDNKRYISSLRLNWSIVGKDEINMVDFIAIEAIRVVAPQFYSAISSNKSLFTGLESSLPSLQWEDNTSKAKKYQELLEKAPNEIRSTIEKICDELFPQLSSGYSYASDIQQDWRKERQICAEERFDFYFQLGIPEGAVSETEITEVLKSLENGTFKGSVDNFHTDKRLRPMLSKLLDYTKGLSEIQARELTKVLWNLEETIHNGREGVFDFDDIETQTMRLVYHTIKNSIQIEKRGSFLIDLIQDNDNLYPPVHFVSVLKQEFEKSSERIEKPLVTEEDISKPEALLLERIRESAKNGSLSTEENFAFFLYRWKDWENETAPKNYVSGLTKTSEGVGVFLRGFFGKVYSSAGNYYQLNKKGLFEFIPQKELDLLVSSVSESELGKMDKKTNEAFDKYKNPPKDHWQV